jgi:hypothetical protein
MTPNELTVPTKGFTKAERAWLEQLVLAIKTAQPIAGTNVRIDVQAGQGTVVNVSSS